MSAPAHRVDPWLRSAQRGEPVAREALVQRYGPLVWSLCRRLAPDAEDAYQAAWLKVLRALPDFDPSGSASLATWIRTITHRTLVDRHRRRLVRGEIAPPVDLADPRPTAESQLADAHRRERLEQALARLPEGQRRVVVLHHLHGVSLQAIADEEGVAVGTVKSRLHRARARLAATLGGTP